MESIVSVRLRYDFHFGLKFSTGEMGVFNVRLYFEKGISSAVHTGRLFG